MPDSNLTHVSPSSSNSVTVLCDAVRPLGSSTTKNLEAESIKAPCARAPELSDCARVKISSRSIPKDDGMTVRAAQSIRVIVGLHLDM
jgi:hypothetical protein